MLRKTTSYRSNGIVIIKPLCSKKLGKHYMQEKENTNHLSAGEKHIAKVYQKIMK